MNHQKKDIYKQFKNVANKKSTIALLMILSFLEASVFFILPDFYLFPLSVLVPKKALRNFLLLFLSSILGSITYLLIIPIDNVFFENLLVKSPFVNRGMVSSAYSFIDGGFLKILYQSISGIPAKVWTYTAVTKGTNSLMFICAIGISRILRMFIVTTSGKLLGTYKAQFFKKNLFFLSIVYIFGFFLLLTIISRSYL